MLTFADYDKVHSEMRAVHVMTHSYDGHQVEAVYVGLRDPEPVLNEVIVRESGGVWKDVSDLVVCRCRSKPITLDYIAELQAMKKRIVLLLIPALLAAGFERVDSFELGIGEDS